MFDAYSNLGRDLPMLLWFLFLRLVVPLVVVFLVGWALWRKFAPSEAAERRIGLFQFVFRIRKRVRPIRRPRLSAGQIFALTVVFLIWITAAGFLLARLFYGLGKASNMNDYMPWGLWIAFKLGFVACAAGGFTFAGIVYVFRLEQYRPIVRTAILTALLGYSTFVISLLIDLGRWYNIWHPIVMWNPHSVMFEVAWCVMLYTTVLVFEFSPAVFERFHMVWAERLVHKITLPMVCLGVVLSTLHQSSLGSLYLIMATKLSPLWYTALLPVFFFTSAIATGISLMMVVPVLNTRIFKAKDERKLLATLTKPAAIVLAIYLALKVGDLALRGQLPRAFTFSSTSVLLWVELVVGVAIPLIIFASPQSRTDPNLRLRAALLVIGGTVLNRFNVTIFGFVDYLNSMGASYAPSFGEWMITLGLLTAAIMAYLVIVRFFPVLAEHRVAEPVIAE